jgi:hypothetical protein
VIRIDVNHVPVFFSGDQRSIIVVLCSKGVQLVFGVGTDTDIRRDPEPEFLRLVCGLNDDDSLFLRNRKATCDLVLIRHVSHLPLFSTHTIPQKHWNS